MRGRETAGNDLARRLALVALGMTFFALAALMWPSQARAQPPPLPSCPGSIPPAAPNDACRPVCETPAFTLTTSSVGAGAGTFSATAPAPYDPAPYKTKGDPECAVPAGTNAWDVKQACTFHCVHWHTFIGPAGHPQPSTARVTAAATSGHFLGWTPDSGCRPPTFVGNPKLACVLLVDVNRTVTGAFGASEDMDPPTAPVIVHSATQRQNVTFAIETPSEDEWLAGYEVFIDDTAHTRVRPDATSFTVANLLCQEEHRFRIEAFDSRNSTSSNEVTATTGACPKVPPNGYFHVKPPRTTRMKSAFFHWGARRNGVELPSFKSQCRVDKRRWRTCSSRNGKTVRNLKPGWHTFRVKVGDAQGWDRTPAVWRWQVRR